MVCDRCKHAVRQTAAHLGWRIKRLELGEMTAWPPNGERDHPRLRGQLEGLGFRVRTDAGGVVARIKGLIVDYVYDDLAKSETTLSQLIIADIGQSYPHLSRLFRREEGRTIADYYLAQRMERARKLLATTDERVSTIAYRLHYGTAGRFAAVFREIMGCSPTEYRQHGTYTPRPLDSL